MKEFNQKGWPLVRLGEHADLLSGFAFKSSEFTDNPDDIHLVKGADVQQGFIDWSGCKRWPKLDLEKHAKFRCKEGDVILAMDRPWVPAGLKWGWIKRGDPDCLLVQRVTRLRGRSILLSDYLRYVIGSEVFANYIKPIVTGVNVPHISGKQISDFTFHIPPLPIQHRIADILSAYDNLIENNQRRIQILENMARSLYREWFVEFRFPGYENVKFVDSPLGKIPEGWELRTLSSLCTRMESGGTPSRKIKEYWNGGDIDWYKTGELCDGFLFNSQEKITILGHQKSTARLFDPGTLLMAIYGSPTVGRLGITTQTSSCNQAALGLVAEKKFLSQTFLYFILLTLRDYFNSMAQGAAQQNISKEKVAGARCVLPFRDLISAFDQHAETMLSSIYNCSVPWDYIPKRSYPLFQAREALRTLRDELRTTKRLLPTTPSPT